MKLQRNQSRRLTSTLVSALVFGSDVALFPLTGASLPPPPFINRNNTEEIDRQTIESVAPHPAMQQVTSVSQLTDLRPSDWALQALTALVERYGCIVGYPDKTFQGNQSITRYEFAAGLNACLARIEEILATATANSQVRSEDLITLQRLQEQFAAELATLGGRTGALEVRANTLERQQFSPTTKLFGQVVIGVQGRSKNRADFFPIDGRRDFDDPGTQTNITSNAQLSLFTQFSNGGVLLTGLQAGSGNTGNPVASNNVRLGYEGDTNGSLILSDLTYRQLLSRNLALIVGPAGVSMVNVFRGDNRVESAGFGPLSRFAQRNPVLNIGNGRGGVGVDWQVNPRISLQAVYSASTPEFSGSGIFGGTSGETTAGVQITIAPTRSINVALYYVNAYSPFGRLATGVGEDFLTTVGTPLKTNGVGGTVSWQVSPGFAIGGWGGYTNSKIPGESGRVETVNWMAFLNFPDLLGKGNLGGIYVGQPPKITQSNLPTGFNLPTLLSAPFDGSAGNSPGTTTHVEMFYRWRISDQITVTPGVIVLFSPGNTPASDTITIGALRTTFTF